MHDTRNDADVDSGISVPVLSSAGFADEPDIEEYPPDDDGPTSPDQYEPRHNYAAMSTDALVALANAAPTGGAVREACMDEMYLRAFGERPPVRVA